MDDSFPHMAVLRHPDWCRSTGRLGSHAVTAKPRHSSMNVGSSVANATAPYFSTTLHLLLSPTSSMEELFRFMFVFYSGPGGAAGFKPTDAPSGRIDQGRS